MIKNVNVNFFKTWTPAMAWVLGVIASDGCVYIHKKSYRNQLIIEMKDLDVLEKIRLAMNSDHKILKIEYIKWNRKFSINRLVIARKEIVNDLVRLGITPRKSKTLKMPNVPNKYFSHFVRGYLDGDGSVIRIKNPRRLSFNYSIVCGSKAFTEQLMYELNKRGFHSSYLVKDSGAFLVSITNKVGRWLYREKDFWYGERKYHKEIDSL